MSLLSLAGLIILIILVFVAGGISMIWAYPDTKKILYMAIKKSVTIKIPQDNRSSIGNEYFNSGFVAAKKSSKMFLSCCGYHRRPDWGIRYRSIFYENRLFILPTSGHLYMRSSQGCHGFIDLMTVAGMSIVFTL